MTATIPAWELEQLDALAAKGELSGVSPQILAAIDQAESSGAGGAINPEGYGGYFGLGVGSKYPAAPQTPVPASLLEGTSTTAFDTQAILAASDYASLLAGFGGNVLEAEQGYQQGGGAAASYATNPGEGVKVFEALGLGGTAQPGQTATATLTSSSGLGGAVKDAITTNVGLGGVLADVTGISGVVGQAEKGAFEILLTIAFVVAALGLILLGLGRLFPGVSKSISSLRTNLPALAALAA